MSHLTKCNTNSKTRTMSGQQTIHTLSCRGLFTRHKEMIVKRPHTKTDIPPVTPGVERVAFMNILGVMFQENMSFTMQEDCLVARGAQTMYALGTLKNHGLNNCALWEVTRATLLSRHKHGGGCWMVQGANDCKVSSIGQLRGVSCQALNQPSQKYVTMLTNVFSLQY